MSSSNSYQTINDSKYNFLLDKGDWGIALRDTIEKTARKKKIVFIEGYDDKVIFEIIFFNEHSEKLFFLDVSLEQAKRTSHLNVVATGGCEEVKSLLIDFVQFLPQDKRFYGVIDRDLKTNQEIDAERKKVCYNGRLFIFSERYTLENYFIDLGVLKDFIHGQSGNYKKLIPLVNDDAKQNNYAKLEEIITDIILCLARIAAANLTIQFFDNTVKFVEETIDCANDEVKKRVHDRLAQSENYVKAFVDAKFQHMQDFVMQSCPENVQKFASAKTYFASQFNKRLQADYKVSLQLNHHKSELARILKNYLPNEFNTLLEFLIENRIKNP